MSASGLFTSPFLKIGGTAISLSLIVQIILSLLIVIFLTRAFKEFLKRRLLIRLGIDEGNRAALATIISYGIGTLGLLVVLQTAGLELASLAVLVGGLGVGIGFGLQNATKDLLGGLTLLMERSIKVGDFVEFGMRQEFTGLQGTVREIALRSTIIETKDGASLVVPNSQLVQGAILNWSYKNAKSRIHIPVRVGYGSDLLLVTETLLKSAYMEPAILDEPPPQVIFIRFGDSCLDFQLRVWINQMVKEIDIKSSLSFIIEYNLRQQGIPIPFPQRDLWLRNPDALTQPVPQMELGKTIHQQPLPVESAKSLSLRNLLGQVNYFKKFNELELRQLIEIGYRKRVRKSEILFRENDPGDAFYIILSGSVEVFAEKLNKQLNTLRTGEFLGELSLMLGIPRTATVRALEDTILFAINNKGFEKLLQARPELAEAIVETLGEHQEELSARQKQLRELGLVDAAEDDNNLVAWVRKRLKKLFRF